MSPCLIGTVARPHGVHGELLLTSHSDHPGRFASLEHVLVGPDEARARVYGITHVREQGDRVRISLDGVDSRERAEQLVGSGVWIEDDRMLPAPAGRPYVHELIGCRVTTIDGEARGRVVDVWLLPANAVLVLDDDGTEVLVPYVPALIRDTNIAERTIVVENLPGLFGDRDAD